MPEPAKQRMTYAEYLGVLETSDVKYEFLDGELLAMAGGTADHALIALNIGATLRTALRGGPCRAYGADLRIHPPHTDFSAFADGSVLCGPREHALDDPNSASNPTVVVEVLSDSTEAYDRGEKFRRYNRLSSFKTYVLVSQRRPVVEVFERQADDRWLLTRHEGLDAIAHLESIDVDLPLSEVYLGAEFLQAEPAD